jgi:hypothetical protein
MKPRSIKTVLDIIDTDMEDLRDTFPMSVDQVTPSFLRDFGLKKQVIQPMEEKPPVLRSILLRASQTRRGLSEDEKKTSENICSYMFKDSVTQNTILHQSSAILEAQLFKTS